MHYYTYYTYEQWGRGYIGSRQSKVPPEQDTKYMGSFRDKTFKPTHKIILASHYKTREEAMIDEQKLHKFYQVHKNPHFANKAILSSEKLLLSPEMSRQIGLNAKKNKTGIFAMTPEERSAHGKKAGYRLLEEGKGLFALTTEERKAIAKRTLEQGKGFASISMEDRIEHGKRVIQQQKETGTGIFAMTHEQRSEIRKQVWKRRKEQGITSVISPEQYKQIFEQQKKNKTGIFSLTPEQRKEIGKKVGQQNKENKIGIFGLTKEQRSEMRRKEHKARTPEQKSKALNKLWDGNRKYWDQFTPEQRSEMARKQQANRDPERRSVNQRWQCTETGYVTGPGALSRYQKKRGIDTSKRIRLS